MMAGSADVTLESRPGRDCTVVRVVGTLDLATAPAMQACLQEAIDGGARVIVLDLDGVGLIDSSALGALVAVHKELRQHEGRLCLAAVRPLVRRVFELTSVDRLVRIYDSVEAAEADLAAAVG